MIADLVRNGAPQDVIDRIAAGGEEERPACFEVWPENWTAIGLFLAASDCWVLAGMDAVPARFDVVAAEAVWRLSAMRVRPADFLKVQTIAASAAEEMRAVIAEHQPKEKAKEGQPAP
jgi:hypothetical protein